MFSFFRQKKQNELRACVQGILNRSAPRLRTSGDLRLEPRYSRSVAIVLIPWDEEPLVEHASYALVHDLSDRGARIIAQKPILVPELLCCFAVDNTRMLRGSTVGQARPLGGGFWQCGVKFQEVILDTDYLQLEELQPLFEGLNPTEDAASESAVAAAR
jgi:hypothetical protein